jgi:hypothetical protein
MLPVCASQNGDWLSFLHSVSFHPAEALEQFQQLEITCLDHLLRCDRQEVFQKLGFSAHQQELLYRALAEVEQCRAAGQTVAERKQLLDFFEHVFDARCSSRSPDAWIALLRQHGVLSLESLLRIPEAEVDYWARAQAGQFVSKERDLVRTELRRRSKQL